MNDEGHETRILPEALPMRFHRCGFLVHALSAPSFPRDIMLTDVSQSIHRNSVNKV